MGDTATPAEIQRLYSIATAAYPLHADSALRPMTSDEVAAMDAYVNRRLELPAPPTFLSCTATGLKRAAMLVFHHEHVEAALIADVPANVRLGKYISRQSILRELVAANGGDEAGRLRPTIGQAVARQPSAQGRNPQRNHSRPATKAEEAAQRYGATLDAYRELAADTDSDSECEDAELKRESSCENTQTPTSLDPVRVAREHAVLLRQQESKTEDSPPVAVEQDPVHPDVEMDDAGSGLSPGEKGAHNGQVIAPACPNVFADIHSPSSETQPSREPYWHKASPVTPTPMDTDDLVAETAPGSDSDSDGFVVEKVVAAVDDHRRTYQEWIDMDSMNAIDSRLAKRLHSENDSAFAWWIAHEGSNYSIPKTPEGQRPWLALLDWMCEHPAAMHHVLAYLPFPEIAAQCCTPAQLAQWGERELYLVQIQTLERIWTDDDSDDRARDLCSAWLDRCKSAPALEALDIASDRTQWGALSELVDASLLRLRPLEIPLEHWFILHVLPFAVADWTASPMGRAPTSAMALWYNEYNSIQRLCTDIADNRDWSAAARLSLGVTQFESPPTAAAAADHGGDSAARRK
ncbi:hypothetical protein PF003_g34625 [Phytophthora fragariae]|nr:hypothetical protein PF003_g34625 [Phytophthora fragariae]